MFFLGSEVAIFAQRLGRISQLVLTENSRTCHNDDFESQELNSNGHSNCNQSPPADFKNQWRLKALSHCLHISYPEALPML